MAWVHYSLVFRLESPLHIGWRKVGNLMQTRPYVPGKVLWAALTARLTQDLGYGASGQKYRDIGQRVQENFRFGYLWPSVDGQTLCFPWEYDDFDYLLLDSYASTAQDPACGAAEEGSLHETEFIAPFTRDGRTVFLVGDLWVESSLPSDLQCWQKALGKVQLGGERTYGWGRVRLEKMEKSGSRQTVAGYEWEEKCGEVIIKLKENYHLIAHALAAGEGAVQNVSGPVEPLVGWEMNEQGRFQLSQALICWQPGAVIAADLSVRIGANGIWKAL